MKTVAWGGLILLSLFMMGCVGGGISTTDGDAHQAFDASDGRADSTYEKDDHDVGKGSDANQPLEDTGDSRDGVDKEDGIQERDALGDLDGDAAMDAQGQDLAQPDIGPGDNGYSEACQGAWECASTYCLEDPNYPSESPQCTVGCTGLNGLCPDPHDACVQLGTEYVCNPVPDNRRVGEHCVKPEECKEGLCLQNLLNQGVSYCTRPCQDRNDCPSGFGCHKKGGQSPGVCVFVGRTCSAGGSECFETGVCMDRETGPYCTAECTTINDCPGPLFSCEPVGGKNICVTSAEGGPIGSGCDGTQQNDCMTAICITFEKPVVFHVCSDVCTMLRGCPDGFACAPAPDMQSYCVPSGTGLLGDACGKEADCMTGSCSCATVQCPMGGYCSVGCGNNAPCPKGWSCKPGLLTTGANVTICQPAE